MRALALFGLVAAAVCLLPTFGEAARAQGANAEWSEDFSGGLDDWIVPLPKDWRQLEEDGDGFLRLAVGYPIGTPRRPVKFAVYKPACVGDFELDVRMRRHERSLIVVFGYQDRSRFYYTHLSSDDGTHSVHNGLFKVHGGSRYRISGLDTPPALPSEEWHDVRVTRVGDEIAVYIDDAEDALFTARDPWFRYGRVGLGSFDETGDFDDFRLSGAASEACRDDDLSPLDP